MKTKIEHTHIHALPGGSDRYGPCEVCKKAMGTAYMGKFYRTIRHADGGISCPWFDKFGHRECLEKFVVDYSSALGYKILPFDA